MSKIAEELLELNKKTSKQIYHKLKKIGGNDFEVESNTNEIHKDNLIKLFPNCEKAINMFDEDPVHLNSVLITEPRILIIPIAANLCSCTLYDNDLKKVARCVANITTVENIVRSYIKKGLLNNEKD